MSNVRRAIVLGLLPAAVAATSFGQAGGATVSVEGAWARRAAMLGSAGSPGGTGNGAVYGVLANAGAQPDALVAAHTDAAGAVEIHESYQDAGMAKMRRIPKIDLPARGSVEMKPGGYHIMLLNLRRDLEAGTVVDLTLQFEKAGTIAVSARIR